MIVFRGDHVIMVMYKMDAPMAKSDRRLVSAANGRRQKSHILNDELLDYPIYLLFITDNAVPLPFPRRSSQLTHFPLIQQKIALPEKVGQLGGSDPY